MKKKSSFLLYNYETCFFLNKIKIKNAKKYIKCYFKNNFRNNFLNNKLYYHYCKD